MPSKELIPNLFRTEYSKIVSVLCKSFGLSNIEMAEDIASETFMVATETWGLKGIPDNPKAWLYTVAKNKVRDTFRREKLFRDKIKPQLERKTHFSEDFEIDLSEPNIQDSQLKMLFAICNPVISSESQIAMALRILCGFGVPEIATAFLTNTETINKRLYRAKARLRAENIGLGIPSLTKMEERLANVLSVLYLLFNEGYYSTTNEKNIRKELCMEAMRLNLLLLDYEPTNTSNANALMALFCFHASRFDARINENGAQIIYAAQKVADWDQQLIEKGKHYLYLSGQERKLTKYHIEALIAQWHTQKNDTHEKWESILQLYNHLLRLEYSPIVALNRTYALAKANGVTEAITACLKIDLVQNHLYHLLLAELYTTVDLNKKQEHLNTALKLVNTASEQEWIRHKLAEMSTNKPL